MMTSRAPIGVEDAPVPQKMLPYGRQTIDESDIAAVVEALRSDCLTTGPKVEEFERCFAARVGARHAVAVNSATSALHLAMRVIGVGATPDFKDIDPVSYNLDPAALEQGWQSDTKAVVAVDYAGQPCDMPAIAEIARERGAVVIEDACHGVGGGFDHEGRRWKLGGHPWADMTVFSFHPVKTMTTGEGGMLVTDNEAWAEKARALRSHGVARKNFAGLGADEIPAFAERGPWYYEMHDLGYNYRITDIQSALGLSQLARLDESIRRRREIVAHYNEAFAGVAPITIPGLRNPANRDHISWHLYTAQIDFEAIGKSRTQVMRELRALGIGTQVLYIPVHLQPWYRKTYGYRRAKCPVAESYYRHALSLPLYSAMTDDDVRRVMGAVTQVLME